MDFGKIPFVLIKDEDIQRMQGFVVDRLNNISDIPLLNGRLIEGVSIGTTETDVSHKLGRPFRGWFIVRKRGMGDVYESTQTEPAKFLKLLSSVQVTVDLWVF